VKALKAAREGRAKRRELIFRYGLKKARSLAEDKAMFLRRIKKLKGSKFKRPLPLSEAEKKALSGLIKDYNSKKQTYEPFDKLYRFY